MLNNSPLKECKRCHEKKALDQFYNHSQTSDGKGSYCKDCQKRVSNYVDPATVSNKSKYAKQFFVHQNLATI